MAYALGFNAEITQLISECRDWRLEEVRRARGTPSRHALQPFWIMRGYARGEEEYWINVEVKDAYVDEPRYWILYREGRCWVQGLSNPWVSNFDRGESKLDAARNIALWTEPLWNDEQRQRQRERNDFIRENESEATLSLPLQRIPRGPRRYQDPELARSMRWHLEDCEPFTWDEYVAWCLWGGGETRFQPE